MRQTHVAMQKLRPSPRQVRSLRTPLKNQLNFVSSTSVSTCISADSPFSTNYRKSSLKKYLFGWNETLSYSDYFAAAIEERDHIASEVGGELDVVRQRSAHLETHCERLSSELGKLRKECKMAECRIAALVEENAALRGKVGCSPSHFYLHQYFNHFLFMQLQTKPEAIFSDFKISRRRVRRRS